MGWGIVQISLSCVAVWASNMKEVTIAPRVGPVVGELEAEEVFIEIVGARECDGSVASRVVSSSTSGHRDVVLGDVRSLSPTAGTRHPLKPLGEAWSGASDRTRSMRTDSGCGDSNTSLGR